jgi:hypothetical protein
VITERKHAMTTQQHISPMEKMLPEPKRLVALNEWELNRLVQYIEENIYWNFDPNEDQKLGKLLAKIEKARSM